MKDGGCVWHLALLLFTLARVEQQRKGKGGGTHALSPPDGIKALSLLPPREFRKLATDCPPFNACFSPIWLSSSISRFLPRSYRRCCLCLLLSPPPPHFLPPPSPFLPTTRASSYANARDTSATTTPFLSLSLSLSLSIPIPFHPIPLCGTLYDRCCLNQVFFCLRPLVFLSKFVKFQYSFSS